MRQLWLLVLGLSLAVAVVPAQQQGVYLGATGGYSFGVPLTVTRDPGIVNRYFGVQLEGTSTDHLGWAGLGMRVPDLFSNHLGLSAELSLALSAGTFSSRAFAFDSIYVPSSSIWVDALYTTELSTLLSMLQLDLQAQYRLSNRFTIGAGPWFTARLSSGIFQQEHLVGTIPEVNIDNLERTRTVAAGKPLASGVFRWGGIVSLSYMTPLAQGMDLVITPHARVDGLALVADNLGLRSVRGGLNMSLLFDVSGREALPATPEIVYIRDTVRLVSDNAPIATATPVQKPVLEAEIKLYSRDGNNERTPQVTLRRISTYYRQSSEISPVVFFDSNSVALPNRYERVSAESAASFVPRMLAPLTPLKAYYQVLNIIGMRMKENAAARIVLTGSASKGEPRRLAQARCETIEAYFRDVWMIDQSRIDIRSAGAADGRSVSISSNSSALLAPFVSEWKVRELEAPAVRLSHSVKAAAGVRNWVLVLTHNGARVGYHSGTSLQELDDLDLSFQMNSATASNELGALRAELTVEDHTGGSVVSYAELPVVWDEAAIVTPASKSDRENVSAVLFPSANDVRPEKNSVLHSLLTSVRDGAHITIASLVRGDHTDEQRMLRPDYVAETILSSLKSRNIQVAELHIQRQADNIPTSIRDFPESDLFRSAVCVTVEQGGE